MNELDAVPHAGEELDAAIVRARRTLTSSEKLWSGIVRETGLPLSELRAALDERHAVTIMEDDRVEGSHIEQSHWHAGGHLCAALLRDGDRSMFLCADPWDALATAQAARHPAATVVLAREGQLSRVAARLRPHDAASPVVAFVDGAIARAQADGASDVHFETSRSGLLVKYRLDGVMEQGEQLHDGERAQQVISRIKVMAQLDITETRRPQDGRIRWEGAEAKAVDLRASIMPSIFGEDAVLRLLDKTRLGRDGDGITLGSLGFESGVAARIAALAGMPHGMLLVTGPTGSGKTTTVYAALCAVNNGAEKIVTIEDPVEYELPGVLQIPVNEQKGLTFATGLRSILRHDPDRILVGEIRDAETAEIAVQSSLTGHLVMTTVHANSLFDVLGRFQHFGIDPFALASALNGVVVQRLLRRLCDRCATRRVVHEKERTLFARCGLPPPESLSSASGCPACRGSGYRGRFVVAEIHHLSDSHRDMIVRRATVSEMKRSLYEQEASLVSCAMQWAASGQTSLEEIRRVVGPI